MKEEERIRCPVHNLISFKRSRKEDALLWELLQTPPVQRLRRIKQLGFSEFVYPGATHSRLSHVLYQTAEWLTLAGIHKSPAK